MLVLHHCRYYQRSHPHPANPVTGWPAWTWFYDCCRGWSYLWAYSHRLFLGNYSGNQITTG